MNQHNSFCIPNRQFEGILNMWICLKNLETVLYFPFVDNPDLDQWNMRHVKKLPMVQIFEGDF